MKATTLLATLLIGLGSGNAIAENWAGPTVGLTVGGAWHMSEGDGESFDDLDPEALYVWSLTNEDETSSGLLAGVKAAYTWQNGDLVYGVIADFNFTSADDESGTLSYSDYSYHREDKLDWIATIRGRIGKDMSGFLPYVTGGLAIADITNVHQTITCCPTLFESNNDDLRYGWVLGLGFEKKITNSVSLSLEGLYVGFPEEGGETTTPPNPDGPYYSGVDLNNTVYLLNLGLNYYFK